MMPTLYSKKVGQISILIEYSHKFLKIVQNFLTENAAINKLQVNSNVRTLIQRVLISVVADFNPHWLPLVLPSFGTFDVLALGPNNSSATKKKR